MNDTHLIVVGVDGSDGGRRALEWAAKEAAARGSALKAVTAWRWDVPHGGLPEAIIGTAQSADADRQSEEQQAADLLASEVSALPTRVAVASQVLEGRAADVLADAARDADLLVVGSHGRSRVMTTVLGSVAQECIRKATCPVVVIPVPHDAELPASPPAVR